MVREYAAAHPDAKPNAIADALSEQTGAKFTNQQVSTVLHQAKKKAGGGKAKAVRAGTKKAIKNMRMAEQQLALSLAAQLVGATGGFAQAKEQIDILEQAARDMQQVLKQI